MLLIFKNFFWLFKENEKRIVTTKFFQKYF